MVLNRPTALNDSFHCIWAAISSCERPHAVGSKRYRATLNGVQGDMHICIVTEDFLPNIGGMSQHVYEIGRCFVQMDHKVTIVNQVREPRPETVEDFAGMRVIRSSYVSINSRARLIPYSVKLRRLILREHERSPIDVIHWHDLQAGTAIKYLPLNCRKVFTNHSSAFLMRRSNPLYRCYYRFSLMHADHFIAPSQELADENEKMLSRPTTFIPNGYDPDRFYPLAENHLRNELGIPETDRVLLVPRRLAPKNGVFVLAQALPRILESHSNARIVITGGGFPEERTRIENCLRAQDCLDRVRFLDGVENQRMPEHYNIADLVIMPSFLEAVSLSALESMGCGKCVVASDVGGLSQLFAGNRWGQLVSPGQPVALADAINDLLSDDARRNELSDAARKHVQANYTWESVARKTLTVFEGNAIPSQQMAA